MRMQVKNGMANKHKPSFMNDCSAERIIMHISSKSQVMMKQRSKLFLGYLLFVPLMMHAQPQDPIKHKENVGGVEWSFTIKDGKAAISEISTSTSGAISIPSSLGGYPVTSIGNQAFRNCKELSSVTIPQSVTRIGERAFEGCGELGTVTIPSSMSSIGGGAFRSCGELTSVTIPGSVAIIGPCAFEDCRELSSLKIQNGVKNICVGAFDGCRELTTVTIPGSVTNICANAFSHCWGLTSVTICDGVKSIGEEAFANCSELVEVTIPGSVTSIGPGAFFYCSHLTTVTICDGVKRIEQSAFASCERLTSITIPSSVSHIGEGAFNWCQELTSAIICKGVTRIPRNAFRFCYKLAAVTIPDSVTRIEADAFCSCSSLASITIPDSVTRIENGAFDGCHHLKSVSLPNHLRGRDGGLSKREKCSIVYRTAKSVANGIGTPNPPPTAPMTEIERIAVAEQAEARGKATVERTKAERKAAERAEAERVAALRAEAERKAAERAEAERKAAERAEVERKAAERAEAERKAAERAEAEHKRLTEVAPRQVAKLAADMVPIPGKDFAISKYEVTQMLWEAVMGTNPALNKGADLPVENISWNDCQKFIETLNSLSEVKNSGFTYRLPTADEWEFACLAGAVVDYCKIADGTEITWNILDEVAWHRDNGYGKTHPVGQKKPNAFGLFDMHGNVGEWTSTGSDSGRVNCGGSWYTDATNCGARDRHVSNPNHRHADIGFRLVR